MRAKRIEPVVQSNEVVECNHGAPSLPIQFLTGLKEGIPVAVLLLFFLLFGAFSCVSLHE